MPIIPVILSGGSGTRLWPLSRKLFPKQFHALVGQHTLLQETLLRLRGLQELGRPIIVANDEHRFLVAEQTREIGIDTDIVLEPVARNTAPAATVAAILAQAAGSDAVLVILPADHQIADTERFHRALETAVEHARQEKLVTFGVVPNRPETGYGYLEIGEPLGGGAFALARFVEKPDREAAEEYFASGRFRWNSGMFVFKAATWLEALERHAPAFLPPARAAIGNAREDLTFIRLDEESFGASPADSIDYAVMEHISDGVVVQLEAGWNDIGAWDALAACSPKDGDGNTLRGDVKAYKTRNTLVHASSRLVAAVGLEEAIVVETSDAVLVTTQAHAQGIKEIVNRLQEEKRFEHNTHRAVRRPWGVYDCITGGERYQVKHIIVKPRARLSLQMHHHRAEHWIVVRGTAKVTRGEEEILLTENESTYIPIGVAHRLENPGKIELELIEVQSGTYLGEDDIVRFDDNYGRTADASIDICTVLQANASAK